MKEDYLWDKTGDDAEIARLENALAAFRYQETAPPELPQKVFTLEKPARKTFFRFAFGFGAFASVMFVLAVAWFQISDDKTSAGIPENANLKNELKRAEKTDDNSFVAPREIVDPIESFEEEKPRIAPKVVKARRTTAPAARRRENIAAQQKKFTEPEEPLTKEEQYAYNQLMLALTITGSKLKIVQDKINGIEEQNAVVEK